jgi:hypothetical protein
MIHYMLSTQIKSEKNQGQVNVGSDKGDAHGGKRGVISGEGRIQQQCLAGLPTWDQTAQGLAVLKIPQNPRLPNRLQDFQEDFQNS